jgi:hypothetical protein
MVRCYFNAYLLVIHNKYTNMLSQCAYNLIQRDKQLFKKFKKQPLHVDVIFEAGMFNGSHQIGFLCYLKKLEEKGYVKVHRLSGCSVGSIIALCYYLDVNFDIHMQQLSNLLYNHVKKTYNIDIFGTFLEYFKEHMSEDIFQRINGNLFISYHDVKKGKQIVKNNYNDLEDIFETIRRSCSIPFVIDERILYKDRYMDGFYPYMFKPKEGRKIINLSILNTENITQMITIKNEKTNTKRIVEGILDTHRFFTSKFTCVMCSYVDQWSLIDNLKYFVLIKIMTIIPYIIHGIYNLNQLLKNSTNITNLSMRIIRYIIKNTIL